MQFPTQDFLKMLGPGKYKFLPTRMFILVIDLAVKIFHPYEGFKTIAEHVKFA